MNRKSNEIKISWYIDSKLPLTIHIEEFINILQEHLPQALPRLYGSCEPPCFEFKNRGLSHFINFVHKEELPVIYCTKPFKFIFLSDAFRQNSFSKNTSYRCNQIELIMSKSAYNSPKWKNKVREIFINVAKLYKPFYAQIINDDLDTIMSWWWKGIPKIRGDYFIIGLPYSQLCSGFNDEQQICNGVYLVENNDSNVKIPRNIIARKLLFVQKNASIIDSYKYAKVFPFL